MSMIQRLNNKMRQQKNFFFFSLKPFSFFSKRIK